MPSTEVISCYSSTLLVAIILIVSCSIFLPIQASNVGFSAQLIHRDSPMSPLFNPNISHPERREMAFQRSLQTSRQIGTVGLVPDAAQYLMQMSYGNPPTQSYLIVDTGSSLTWIQCLPCIHCYPSQTPPFNPLKSSTYHPLSCTLKKCLQLNNLKNNSCQPLNQPCKYELKYLDGSYSRGALATETIAVGNHIHNVIQPGFIFGCGHDNGGGTFPHKAAGLIAFGPEDHSFFSQLRPHHGGKFSHCMAPVTSSPGRISFGSEAVISGPGVVTTPLIIGEHDYSVMLEGISVGNKTVRFSSENLTEVNSDRIVLDTGTEAIFLPERLLLHYELLVRKAINMRPTALLPFTLCYPVTLRDADIPKIIFHFRGANLELKPANTFLKSFIIGALHFCVMIPLGYLAIWQ